MGEQREYHIEESKGFAAGGIMLERMNELEREGWGCAVVQPMQRLNGSVFLVLIMSRPAKIEFELRVMGKKVTKEPDNG